VGLPGPTRPNSSPVSAVPGWPRPHHVEPLSPGRYKIQFTAGADLRDKLERLVAVFAPHPGRDQAHRARARRRAMPLRGRAGSSIHRAWRPRVPSPAAVWPRRRPFAGRHVLVVSGPQPIPGRDRLRPAAHGEAPTRRGSSRRSAGFPRHREPGRGRSWPQHRALSFARAPTAVLPSRRQRMRSCRSARTTSRAGAAARGHGPWPGPRDLRVERPGRGPGPRPCQRTFRTPDATGRRGDPAGNCLNPNALGHRVRGMPLATAMTGSRVAPGGDTPCGPECSSRPASRLAW
jgi:hypothetical protein